MSKQSIVASLLLASTTPAISMYLTTQSDTTVITFEKAKQCSDPVQMRSLLDNWYHRSQFYTHQQLAKEINTPASQTYNATNEQWFNPAITPEVIKDLVKTGIADINYTQDYDYKRITPLIYYITHTPTPQTPIVSCFLDYGANVNGYKTEMIKLPNAPLKGAIEKKLHDIVALLLQWHPTELYFIDAIECHTSIEILSLLITALQDHPDKQMLLNKGLNEVLFLSSFNLMEPLLKAGAHPDHALFFLANCITGKSRELYGKTVSQEELLGIFFRVLEYPTHHPDTNDTVRASVTNTLTVCQRILDSLPKKPD